MRHTIIYKLSDPRTGTIRYIGKTTNKLSYRLQAHCSRKRMTKTVAWIRSLNKLNLLPIIEEVDSCSWEESSMFEMFYISHYRRFGCVLTNMTDGGEGTLGWIPSTETRRKISNANKGNSYWLGKSHSDESKNKISVANKDRRMPKEFSEKRRSHQINSNWKPSQDMIRRMRETHSRKVIQMDLDGREICTFSSIKEAGIAVDISPTAIVKACRGKCKTSKGYKWRYL